MIRLWVLTLTILSLYSQSSFLNGDEIRSIKKGHEWQIYVADSATFSLSFDIWKNTYSVYNKTTSKSYKSVDSIFIDIKRNYSVTEVSVFQRRKEGKSSDVFLVDIVSKFIDRFKKRTVKL